MRVIYLTITAIVTALIPTFLQANTIVAYVEAPTIQSSSVANVTTETFNSLTPGTYTSNYVSAIGTYAGSASSPFAIVAADQYGGAGGTGNYFALGAESHSDAPVTVTLNSEANYFGFWWSAGDPNNVITFIQDGVALATFTTANLDQLLPYSAGTTVTAINGSVYNTINYYGNPNNQEDAWEPFAYVDVIANGLQFNQIQFANATTATGFESDNHSVAAGVTTPPQGDVIVEDVPLTDAAEAPEPASSLLLLSGVAAAGLLFIRSGLCGKPEHRGAPVTPPFGMYSITPRRV